MGWEAVIWSPSVKTMRHWTTLLIVAALTACSDKRPVDCEVLRDETFACMDRVAGSGERNSSAIFDECFPMSEPQRFTGTWATDFEVNEFHDFPSRTKRKTRPSGERFQLFYVATAFFPAGGSLILTPATFSVKEKESNGMRLAKRHKIIWPWPDDLRRTTPQARSPPRAVAARPAPGQAAPSPAPPRTPTAMPTRCCRTSTSGGCTRSAPMRPRR